MTSPLISRGRVLSTHSLQSIHHLLPSNRRNLHLTHILRNQILLRITPVHTKPSQQRNKLQQHPKRDHIMLRPRHLTRIKCTLTIDIRNFSLRHKRLPIRIGKRITIYGTPIGRIDIKQHRSTLVTIRARNLTLLSNLHKSNTLLITLDHCVVITLVNCNGGTARLVVALDGCAGEALACFDGFNDGDAGATLTVEDDPGWGVEGGFEGAAFALHGEGRGRHG
mmetsp:Transcript_20534/g.41000  ORF Transcript_20534/g.41000 Transcript_20534/m.41000 type:complete len:223 (+) Transcript_20534:169-837(+)